MFSKLIQFSKNKLVIVGLTALFVVHCDHFEKKSLDSYQGHGAESIKPEVLKQYAPVAVPSEVSARIQSMLDVRAPGFGKLSPDGKRLYFDWSVTGITQIWKIDGPKMFPTQMTGGEDKTQAVSITADGKYLIVSRDRKGEENPGLYLQKSEGGPLIEIQHKKGIQTFYQWTTDDGRYIFYGSNDIKPDSYALYRYDIQDGSKSKIFDEPGIWEIQDMTRDAKKMLLLKNTGSMRGEVYEYEPASKKLTPVVGQGETEDYNAQYGAHEGELLIKTNKFGNYYRLYSYKAGKFNPVTPDIKFEVEEAVIDIARKHIYYQVNENGFTKLHVLDANTFKEVKLPVLPKADHVYVGSLSRNGRYAIVGIETAKAPRTSFVLDWDSLKVTQWALPSAPEIVTSHFSEAKLEYYPARDGTQIPMFVRRPAKCGEPCPVVVHFHGGPEGQSLPGFSTFAQIFVDAGYIYVEPNVRGSTGYGKAWVHADDREKRINIITDIQDCGDYIKKNWAVNGKAPAVGVMGYSYGGYSTLIAMTMFGGTYNAGVALVGMSNLVTFMQNTAPYRRILRMNEYGDPEKEREMMLKVSAVSYLDRVKDPLMIIQGASDPRVPAGEAIQIHELLKQKGISTDLMIFPDEGHGSAKRENRVLEIGNTLKFFNTHLKKNVSNATALVM